MPVWAALLIWLISLTALGIALKTVAQLRRPAEPISLSDELVAIVIPCKGVEPTLPTLLDALTALDLPRYRVFFTIASAEDSALPLIHAWLQQHTSRGECVIFSPPPGLDGKIGNMIGGMRAALAADAGFIAFVDSDTLPSPQFFARLLAPLQNGEIHLVTGARVLTPTEDSLAQWAVSLWMQCSLPGVVQPQWGSAWGGAMALRADILRKLDLDSIWRNAYSDDHTLSSAIRAQGGRIAFASGCFLANPIHGGWPETFDFMIRQLLVLRLHDRRLWLVSWLFIYPLLLPFLAVALWIQGDLLTALTALTALLPLAAALILLNEAAATGLDRPQMRLRNQPLIHRILTPLSLIALHPYALVRTALLRRFFWRGRWYKTQATGIRPLD
ncbi:MAG: glycosyltransferase [Caldilineales bacterium]|nr:glycosyltransferase [Caldilineales bacterium]